MTTGPGYEPPRPHEPDPTRKEPLGEHADEPGTYPEEEQKGNTVDTRIGSSGERPYGGRPRPDPDSDELPGEWHEADSDPPTDRQRSGPGNM